MIEIALVWVSIIIAFILGVAFNSNAYERGYRDAERRRTDW